MNPSRLLEEYGPALETYISRRDETSMHKAYQLGRAALTDRVPGLAIVHMHHELLADLLNRAQGNGSARDIITASSLFLEECLAPYEMAFSGFREVTTNLEQEITRRKRIELEVREREEYFRSLIENSLDVVTILNEDGTIRYDSPSIERVLGYKQGELTGASIFRLVHPEDRERVRGIFADAIRVAGYSESVVVRVRHKNGTWHILEGSGKNLLNIPGVRGILVTSRDITERIRLLERLDEATRQRADDLQHFARSIQHAQEEERQRIARELHDDLCQRLSAMRMHMSVFEDDIPSGRRASRKRLQGMRRQVDELIEEIRRISANLRPAALDQFGLVTALRHLAHEFQETHRIIVSLETNLGPQSGYGMDVDIAIYRIAQEALTNAAKHSAAQRVSILLHSEAPVLKLAISDDGQGFDVAPEPPARHHGMGLISMRERTELLGGNFRIESAPRKGVLVSVEIPHCNGDGNEKNQAPGG